jgi:hypothetical protein
MRLTLSRNATVIIGVAAAVVGTLSALMAAVTRFDFVQRGCDDIPSDEWIYTSNCTDAFNVDLLAGGPAGVSLAVICWSLWRLYHV